MMALVRATASVRPNSSVGVGRLIGARGEASGVWGALSLLTCLALVIGLGNPLGIMASSLPRLLDERGVVTSLCTRSVDKQACLPMKREA